MNGNLFIGLVLFGTAIASLPREENTWWRIANIAAIWLGAFLIVSELSL